MSQYCGIYASRCKHHHLQTASSIHRRVSNTLVGTATVSDLDRNILNRAPPTGAPHMGVTLVEKPAVFASSTCGTSTTICAAPQMFSVRTQYAHRPHSFSSCQSRSLDDVSNLNWPPFSSDAHVHVCTTHPSHVALTCISQPHNERLVFNAPPTDNTRCGNCCRVSTLAARSVPSFPTAPWARGTHYQLISNIGLVVEILHTSLLVIFTHDDWRRESVV